MHLWIIKEHFHAIVIAAFKLFYCRGSIILTTTVSVNNLVKYQFAS